MIAIAIFLTYALQFYVPMNIIWINIRDQFSEKNKTLAEYATRFSLIVSDFYCSNFKTFKHNVNI